MKQPVRSALRSVASLAGSLLVVLAASCASHPRATTASPGLAGSPKLVPTEPVAARVTQDSAAAPSDAPDTPAEPAASTAAPQHTSPWVALAADPWERGGIELGGLIAAVDSGVQVGPGGVGVSVDLEELLGMNTGIAVARLGGWWRFSKNNRHRADLSWTAMRRSGNKTLGQDLDLGDGTILPTGTQVSTNFDLDIFRATYSYSFLQDDRVDLAATAGVYVMPINFGLNAQGFANLDESLKITAPLPLFGLRADFLLTPRWYLRNSFSLFYLKLGDFSGNMREFRSSVEWRATSWLGLGAGVESFGLGVQAGGPTEIPGLDFQGKVSFQYAGVVLYARGYL